MRWFLPVLLLALASVAPVGCARKSLQMTDASGGIGPIDPGDGGVTDVATTTDAGRGIDTSWDLPVAGRRSYLVTSQVSAGAGLVTAHTFTMTLDTDRHVAITGTIGTVDPVPLEQTATGALRVTQVLSFSVPVPAACGGSLAYDDLAFTIEPDGTLSGSGSGQVTEYLGAGADANTLAATMTLTGVPDTEQPTLSMATSGDPADPWTSIWVVSTEPLPADQMPPVLRSASGDAVAFAVGPGINGVYAIVEKPRLMLGFGEEYRITIDGITDIPGNPARWTGGATFTTRAPPPLVIADGFESVTDDTLGGARILSGAGAPTINGARSLYVPPASSLAPGFVTQVALRLAVSSRSTTLRFSYRFVNPGDAASMSLAIASVGGTIETVSLASNPGDTTTPATIGQDEVRLGPTAAAAIALPPDAHDEIVFALMALQPGPPCGGSAPPPPVAGIIIDDLRVP